MAPWVVLHGFVGRLLPFVTGAFFNLPRKKALPCATVTLPSTTNLPNKPNLKDSPRQWRMLNGVQEQLCTILPAGGTFLLFFPQYRANVLEIGAIWNTLTLSPSSFTPFSCGRIPSVGARIVMKTE